ncbi:MAG TPA: hypothetical protein PKE31_20910 [Pseudomonadota bacterium]|nr:hypothetical protein [Pseudomonadota bacterium]
MNTHSTLFTTSVGDSAKCPSLQTRKPITKKTTSTLRTALLIAAGCVAACAKPVIVDQPDGADSNADAGADLSNSTGLSVFGSRVPDTFELNSQYTPIATQRQWKRDPHFVSAGGSNYLFMSGSIANPNLERWSLSVYTDTGLPTKDSPWSLMFEGATSTSWDKTDVMAPFASFRAVDGWTVYYAANGDPSKPNWVYQIGRATGTDLTKLTRAQQPIIGVPNYTAGQPDIVRPDAWGATDPSVFVDGNDVYLYYAGLNCEGGTCKFQILRSKSPDGGTSFPPGDVVLSGRAGNPEEAGGVAGPSVIKFGTQYLLAYTALKDIPTKDPVSIRNALSKASVGLMVSSDGKTWQTGTKTGGVLVPRLPGFSSNRSEGVSSPSLYVDGNTVRGYVSGRKDDANANLYHIGSLYLIENP